VTRFRHWQVGFRLLLPKSGQFRWNLGWPNFGESDQKATVLAGIPPEWLELTLHKTAGSRPESDHSGRRNLGWPDSREGAWLKFALTGFRRRPDSDGGRLLKHITITYNLFLFLFFSVTHSVNLFNSLQRVFIF